MAGLKGFPNPVDEAGMDAVPETPITEQLVKNLQTLADRDYELAERITWPAANGHVRFEGGKAFTMHQRRWVELEQAVPTPTEREVVWLGIGAGDQIARALEERPDLIVHAWERDPWFLRETLSRHDLAGPIASGRLKLYLGTDVLDLAGSKLPLVLHPVLHHRYRQERHLIERGCLAKYACLSVGKLFVDDMADAMRGRGYTVVPIDDQNWSSEELSRAMRVVQPEFLARINMTGQLVEFTAENDVPLLVWEIDPAIDVLAKPSASTAHTHLFTYREANVEVYRGLGFENVTYMPLASPVARRKPLDMTRSERDHYEAPVVFVGASQVDSADVLEDMLWTMYTDFAGEEALPEFQAACEEMLQEQSAADGWILDELFEARFASFMEHASTVGFDNPVILLGERAASNHRLDTMRELTPLGLDLWGDLGWEEVEGANYRGPAGHTHEITQIYNAARINIDVGRVYQPDIVTMRVFDVLACGGFLIAEHSPVLEELFEVGVELETFKTTEELRTKVRHYLDHPEEAERIAAAGRAAVLARHRFGARVDQMLSSVLPAEARAAS